MTFRHRPVAMPEVNLSKRAPLAGWANAWENMSPELRLRFALHMVRTLDDWKASAELVIEEPVR